MGTDTTAPGWLVASVHKMVHIDYDFFEKTDMYHQVDYFHKPTLDDIKRTCHRIAMSYLGEINYDPNTFDFSPYMVY